MRRRKPGGSTGYYISNFRWCTRQMKISHVLLFSLLLLLSVTRLHAQAPTLSQAAAKAGISGNQFGTAKDFEFSMDPAGYPRAVTSGETIFTMGSWPDGSTPTFADDKANAWAAATSCLDSTGLRHGFFYALNAAANTSVITETHSSAITNTVFDWAHFYNMSTTASGFVDGSSCRTGVTPATNTAPNISGTAYTVGTAGDLILTCVYVEQNPLGDPNPISSVTFPSGFVGLSEDTSFGHACAYGIGAAGTFTPTFTVAQGGHNSFTIMSAAFKAGTGGSTPPVGATILLSEMHYTGTSGQTDTMNLPCPASTTAVVVSDDYGELNSVSDNGSSTYTSIYPPGHSWGPIIYTNGPVISSQNTFTVSLHFTSGGGKELVGLYCVAGTNGVDTAATAKNSSTLTAAGSGSTYNTSASESGGSVAVVVDAPSIGTSVAGDLVFDGGGIGLGPAESCVTGKCVFDYVGSTTWTSGDNEGYSNGDVMAHFYAPTASTVNFEFNAVNTGNTISGVSLALKPASSASSPPDPPTNVGVTVR